MIRQSRLPIVALVALTGLAGCLEKDSQSSDPDMIKLNTYKMGDWLHDIDTANAIMARANRGDFGTPTPELIAKFEPVSRAIRLSKGGTTGDCWPEKEKSVTANTDHACLDSKGWKRSQ